MRSTSQENTSRQATADWTDETIQSEIKDYTSDECIAELVAKCEAEANSYGYTLNSDLVKFMQDRRQEMYDEYEEEA